MRSRQRVPVGSREDNQWLYKNDSGKLVCLFEQPLGFSSRCPSGFTRYRLGFE